MAVKNRLSTRAQVYGLLMLALILFVLVNGLVQRGVVFPAFATFERQAAIADAERAVKALRRELSDLEFHSRSWAYHDDIYTFIHTGNADYARVTLSDSETANSGVDVFAIYDNAGKPLFTAVHRDGLPLQSELAAALALDQALHKQLVQPLLASTESSRTGFFLLKDQLALAASRRILLADESGEPSGVMLLLTLMSPKYHEQIVQSALVDFEFESADSFQAENAQAFRSVDDDEGLFRAVTEEQLQISLKIATLNDRAFVIQTHYERSMARQGKLAITISVALSTLAFVLLVALIYRVVAKSFINPLREMTHRLQRIENEQDLSVRLPEEGAIELQQLSGTFNRMMGEVEQHRDEVARLSLTDALTGLPNRRQFEQVLNREWQHAQRQHSQLALLLLDVDFFKRYNDHYGHQAGDECLKVVASALNNAVKRGTDLVARYGGEEFVVVLPHTGEQGALAAADNLLSDVRAAQLSHEASSVAAYVTISIGGVFGVPATASTIAQWLAAADAALYEAKKQGRDRHVLEAAPTP